MTKPGRPFGSFKNPVRKTSAVYQRWIGMKQRCMNPNSHIWKYYGGRGIRVCARWLGRDGFKNFFADMGEPTPGMTLDRIDNSKGYEPGNCRWATMQQQADNRRNGQVCDPSSLRQRALAAGLPYQQVYLRINRLGWDESKALSTPIMARGRPRA